MLHVDIERLMLWRDGKLPMDEALPDLTAAEQKLLEQRVCRAHSDVFDKSA